MGSNTKIRAPRTEPKPQCEDGRMELGATGELVGGVAVLVTGSLGAEIRSRTEPLQVSLVVTLIAKIRQNTRLSET